jgi:uncharacterized protein involved in exopolysaccharide biosynthesis
MSDQDPIRRALQSSPPTARDVAMVLFRQRKVFLWVCGLVLASALLYAVAGTKYQAHMKVLVRRGRADAPVSAQENAPLDLTRMQATEEDLNSEVELLRDDEVLRKVVQASSLQAHDWLHFLRSGQGQEAQVERAARRLAKKLEVEPVKKTNLIEVSYASEDPQLAAKVLQAVATAYLEKHMEVHRPGGEFHFFEQQTAESRRELEAAKGKLLQFNSRHGVIAAGEQRDLALQKLSEIDASFRQTKIEFAETQRRIWELKIQLTELPERTTTQVRTADNPELLKSLKASLLDLQLKRTQLLTKFEPSHRLVQEVDQQISQAQAAIAGESKSPIQDQTTDRNTQYEWAKSELERAEVQLKGLESRAAATEKEQRSNRTAAQHLGDDAINQDDLASSEKAAEENYLLFVKKQGEARVSDALDQRGIVNVAIAEQPVVPALPVWSAWAVIAVGIAAAGALGTGGAFAANYLTPTFRSRDEVLAYLNAPVLASLPRTKIRGEISI